MQCTIRTVMGSVHEIHVTFERTFASMPAGYLLVIRRRAIRGFTSSSPPLDRRSVCVLTRSPGVAASRVAMRQRILLSYFLSAAGSADRWAVAQRLAAAAGASVCEGWAGPDAGVVDLGDAVIQGMDWRTETDVDAASGMCHRWRHWCERWRVRWD